MAQFSDNNPYPVLSVGTDGTVLYSNEAGEPLLHEWGTSIGQKLPPYFIDVVKGATSIKTPQKIEVKTENSIFLISFHPLPKEECVNIYGFDISEQKELEGKLRESEEKYHNIVETTNDYLVVVDTEFRITYIGKELTDIAGYSQEEVIGRSWLDFVSEDDMTVAKMQMDLRRQGVDDRYELQFVCKNGSSFWALLSAKSLFDKDDNYAGCFAMLTDITQRKQMEEALREAYEKLRIQSKELQFQSDELHKTNKTLCESENKFRTLAENSPDLIARFDRQNQCLYANPAIARFYGCSQKEIVGKTNSELEIDYEFAKFSEKQREKVFAAGKCKIMEFHRISPQGREYYFNTQIVPEFVSDKVNSVLAISRDITNIIKAEIRLKETLDSLEVKVKERTDELEKAYKWLKESERGLAEAQRIAHIGNWEWDVANDIANWSEEMYRIFELNPQERAPSFYEFLNYIHPEDRDCINKIINKRSEGFFDGIDYRIILANGEERTVYTQAEAIFRDNIPIRVKGIVQDITERKKAEEKIKILANVVESSNDAIITESLDCIITSWNKGAEQIYGYLAREVLGKHISILEPENLKGETIQLVEKIKQREKVKDYETLRLKKDGTNISVSITLSPIFDSSGKFLAISCIDRDITEKKIAEKLLQEKIMAEVANRTKNEFLANMSHELRTPLNSIIGFSDMLHEQSYGELNEKQLRSAGNISKSGKHLLNLINNILDISKVEAGKMELNYKNFGLAAKFNMLRNLLSPITDRKNIKIEIDMDGKLTSICADEDKFIQIMYNLVDNAIKFSYENSLVKIGARKKEELVEIMVKDNGIGIKVEDQYKLFKPFSQIDPFSSRKSQGTGLGLSLVKQIVHLHGGYVWFRSNPGEGSTFAFAIPLNKNK